MNSRTVAIVGGVIAIVALLGVIFFVLNKQSKSDIEVFEIIENTTRMENLEISTFMGFDRSKGVLDAPIAPIACNKGMRYDKVSNKCKFVISQAA